MRHFVLVHGAWHHPSCWQAVQNLLEPFGKVYSPYLIPPKKYHDIYLSEYVDCLKNTIQSIQEPVILVGHSFAGFVITALADLLPHLIEELIYINAFIPMANETLFSLSANFKYQHLNPFLQIDTQKQIISIKPKEEAIRWMYQLSHDQENIQLRPEPLIPFNETIFNIANPICSRRAIITKQDLCISTQDQINMCKRQNIPYQLIEGDHCPFKSNPQILSQLIHKGF
jgi:pimeloyl-ACP methyl ester carboxylesterase